MNRDDALRRLRDEPFDVLIIGGGATGLGCAVDSASRGYRTALIEAREFGSGTSSRSTKLIHGGVRYLQQGNIGLVREALAERERLKMNAPGLVKELRFVVPAYAGTQLAYLWAGLKTYDLLARGSSFERSRFTRASEAKGFIPTLRTEGLRGAIVYSDGQFDDAGLIKALAETAFAHGAVLANNVRAEAFDGNGCAVSEGFTIHAKAIVNAGGVFVDEIRRLEDPAAEPMLTFSRGSHIVLPASVLAESRHALLVPKTSDARVLFAIPWKGAVLAGTTDIAADRPEFDPQPAAEEIQFILDALRPYVTAPLSEEQVQSAYAGLRPLLKRRAGTSAQLSREHAVEISKRGLVTIAGGKWTTYRKMAEDAIDAAAARAHLPGTPSSTKTLALHS